MRSWRSRRAHKSPSSDWKIRYSLMLGLERVLSDRPPHLKSGTELRRHQVDALAGMLTELIAAAQREPEAVADEPDEEFEDEEEYENGDAGENGHAEVERTRTRTTTSRPPATPARSAATASATRPRPARRSPPPGFVEAARTIGVLILTHRRLLVTQFNRELKDEGYGDRITPEITGDGRPPKVDPITIQTYAWFARHVGDLNREAYQLVICDEAHTALGEKTSAAIRSFPEPVFIGMTATEQLIAKQVSDVFPASVDDLPLADAARRGLIAPLRCLRVPPAAAINSVPIVGGDFDQDALAKVLDHVALNQAAASLYRERFDSTPGIVYAAGVDHAYNLAQEFRAAGLKAEAVSGRTPPVKLAEILAAYERGDIDVLVNAMLLAEGWNSPRATVVMHLAPTASRRVYQQRIGRIMRLHPRKEAGVVVDFVQKGATHTDRVVTLHSLLGADFYREGARVTPAPRRRVQRRARRKLQPAPWLVPVTPDVNRRLAVIQREWQRVDPRYLDEEEQRFWARIAGRQARFDDRVALFEKLTARASKAALEQFLFTCAAENPNRRLRLMALADRVGMTVDRASFDDLVTLVTQAPPWEKDRVAGRSHPAACDRRGPARRARSDPRPLDLASRPRGAQGARPQGQRRVPGGEASPRRPRELARPPARGERAEARRRREGSADRDRRRAARLGRGLHAARELRCSRRARGARVDPGGRERARRRPARAEGASRTPSEAPPEEEAARRASAAQAQLQGSTRPTRQAAPRM